MNGAESYDALPGMTWIASRDEPQHRDFFRFQGGLTVRGARLALDRAEVSFESYEPEQALLHARLKLDCREEGESHTLTARAACLCFLP